MHMMRPLLHQPNGLSHVVRRSHSRACVATRLLQQAKGIVRPHHLPANSSQAPGGGKAPKVNRRREVNIYAELILKAKSCTYSCLEYK